MKTNKLQISGRIEFYHNGNFIISHSYNYKSQRQKQIDNFRKLHPHLSFEMRITPNIKSW